MPSVPYLYVNFVALCCYVLLLCVFLAVKKTPEVRAFLLVLFALTLWCGASVLMRVQMAPGLRFWFYVSLLALFSVPFFLYCFVCRFAGVSGRPLLYVWGGGTALLLVTAALGWYVRPPVPVATARGIVFSYQTGWQVAVPYAFFLCVVASAVVVLRRLAAERGLRAPGLAAMLAGCAVVCLGNLAQIVPGNTFPWDTLSGIVFAGCLLYALYRRRLLRVTLLFSRGALLAASVAVCYLLALFWVAPVQSALGQAFPRLSNNGGALVVLVFTALFVCIYAAMERVVRGLFAREETQSRRVKQFSARVAQASGAEDILRELIWAVMDEVPAEAVYVCLPGAGGFVPCASSEPYAPAGFAVGSLSPALAGLRAGKPTFLLDDARGTDLYKEVMDADAELFGALGVRCMVALRDAGELAGLLLLTRKPRDAAYTPPELGFLETAAAIASIALANAALHERVYDEARTDSLTGAYNHQTFAARLEAACAAAGGAGEGLALVYLDIDDFTLFNQLYGTAEGDWVLQRLATAAARAVGERGTVFRLSGKVFALLLPGEGETAAKSAAERVQAEVARAAETAGRGNIKPVTISAGIATWPKPAQNPRELKEYANLAVYKAKQSGRGKVVAYHSRPPAMSRIAERALSIIERPDMVGQSSYEAYSSTILALTAAIDAKDHYTYDHSQNVAHYAIILATAIGLSDEQVRLVYEAALLHDIGKISIPESILSKRSSLTGPEAAIIREHVNNSIDMIRHLPSMEYVIPAAVGHHERWDGKGYPLGTAGEDIPIAARCLAIADAFDAMTADRPYRGKMSVAYAISQIEQHAGTQFDPWLARVFVRLVKSGEVQVRAEVQKHTVNL